MKEIAARIHDRTYEIASLLEAADESLLARRPGPDKWSVNEILGHLCDSALNNLPRFIVTRYAGQPAVFQPYKQNEWVAVQDYRHTPSKEIIVLWGSLNRQIARVIASVTPEQGSLLCKIGENEPVTLRWLLEDYEEHMEHHLGQILRLKGQFEEQA
ncbi:DinB family protein [Paenibacillus chitinolyticus]|uniref:DinB family protein n=1 Tax=Paenibacillus chitinolyticus TaxID=79263 RepID=UPI002DBFAE66|nr:DinB family protein [Paenibacillus chitinolyticus]MEC0248748.1 DinB family protein [Paenibacillus chitinolyticus]